MLTIAPVWALPTQWTIEYLAPIGAGFALNNSGNVVGSEFYSGRAWVYSNGVLTMFDEDVSWVDINDSNQVVGVRQNTQQALFWEIGASTAFPLLPEGLSSAALGINGAGQVVGFTWASQVGSRAFLFDGSSLKELAPSFCEGATSCDTTAFAINDNGQAVGRGFRDSTNTPLLFEDDTFVNLTERGLINESYPEDINNSGLIVGNSYASSPRGFLLAGNKVTYFDDFNEMNASYAYGINNDGYVVGHASDGAEVFAWVYDGETLVNLNTLDIAFKEGWHLREAYDINDRGQIVGYGRYNGDQAAFLLSPVIAAVPEPQTYLTMALGLLLLAGVGRRTRRNADMLA